MFWKKNKEPTTRVIFCKSITLTGGKSIYQIDTNEEFMNNVNPNIPILIVMDDNMMLQENEGWIITCDIDEEYLKQLMKSANG